MMNRRTARQACALPQMICSKPAAVKSAIAYASAPALYLPRSWESQASGKYGEEWNLRKPVQAPRPARVRNHFYFCGNGEYSTGTQANPFLSART